MNYKIEKNGPPPPPDGRRHRRVKYPLEEMEPGDSFLIPQQDMTPSIRNSVLESAKKRGFRVKTAREEGGMRVWLISKTRD